VANFKKYSNYFADSALLSIRGIQRSLKMRLLVLSAAIAATVLGVLPASAEIVVREGGTGVVVSDHDRGHDRDWRRHHADCRDVRVRTRENGHVVFKMRHTCN
jgi:hypothetical protein